MGCFFEIQKIITITKVSQKLLDESVSKPNKIWVDNGRKFCNRSTKSWLQNNSIEMYLIHNEGKSVVVERFIITLNSKIYKYVTSISKNVYIGKLDNIVNRYNNTYRSTIKMKSVGVKLNTYVDFNKK